MHGQAEQHLDSSEVNMHISSCAPCTQFFLVGRVKALGEDLTFGFHDTVRPPPARIESITGCSCFCEVSTVEENKKRYPVACLSFHVC